MAKQAKSTSTVSPQHTPAVSSTDNNPSKHPCQDHHLGEAHDANNAVIGEAWRALERPAIAAVDQLVTSGTTWHASRKAHDTALFKLLQECAILEQKVLSDTDEGKAYQVAFQRKMIADLSRKFIPDEESALEGILLVTFNKGNAEANEEFRQMRSTYKIAIHGLVHQRKIAITDIAAIFEAEGLTKVYKQYKGTKASKPTNDASSNIFANSDVLATIDSEEWLSDARNPAYDGQVVLLAARQNSDGSFSVLNVLYDNKLREAAGAISKSEAVHSALDKVLEDVKKKAAVNQPTVAERQSA